MPDFSKLEYSELLDTITLCITVAGIILGLIYSQILHSPPTRQRFISVLQKSKVRNLYQAGVLWFLAFLQRVYGDKAALQAFNVSLILAYLYPILFFLFSYSYLGGSNQFSGTTLLPADSPYRVWVFLGLLFLVGVSALIFYRSDTWDAWGIRQFERCCSPLWAKRAWQGLMGGVAACGFAYLYQSIWGAVFGFLFGFYGGAVAVAVAVAGTFAVTFAVAVAVAVAGAFAVAFAVAVAGAVAVAVAAYAVWLGNYNYSLFFLFFYFCMPFLNALLDWLSWWVSRFFMERTAAEQVSVRVIVLDVVLDFVVAVLFMLALVLLLPAGAMGLDALYAQTVDAKTGLTPQTNWQEYAVWARDEPWGKGIMVTLMLVTTLIPTLLHIFLGLVAFYIHAFKGQALAAFLIQANPEDNIANMQASLWVFGYTVLAGLSMWLLWLGLNQLFHLPIAQWLYAFAKFFYPLPN